MNEAALIGPERHARRLRALGKDTGTLDAALDRETQRAHDLEIIAAAEAEEQRLAQVQAEKVENARQVLAEDVPFLEQHQAKLRSIMEEYLTEYQRGWQYRQSVDQARGVLAHLEDEYVQVPMPLYVQANSEHELRQLLDQFRALAMSGGEV